MWAYVETAQINGTDFHTSTSDFCALGSSKPPNPPDLPMLKYIHDIRDGFENKEYVEVVYATLSQQRTESQLEGGKQQQAEEQR